jgi:hypothetical protein
MNRMAIRTSGRTEHGGDRHHGTSGRTALAIAPRDRSKDFADFRSPGVPDLTPKSMGLLCVNLPKYVAIQDRAVEAHTQGSKFFSKCEHRSKRRHLVRVSDALPYTNIVHSVVRVVDSDVDCRPRR